MQGAGLQVSGAAQMKSISRRTSESWKLRLKILTELRDPQITLQIFKVNQLINVIAAFRPISFSVVVSGMISRKESWKKSS